MASLRGLRGPSWDSETLQARLRRATSVGSLSDPTTGRPLMQPGDSTSGPIGIRSPTPGTWSMLWLVPLAVAMLVPLLSGCTGAAGCANGSDGQTCVGEGVVAYNGASNGTQTSDP